MRAAELRRARLFPLLAAQSTPPPAASGRLAIVNCRAYVAREPVSKREYAILKIETGGGITGWGETRAILPAELAQATSVLRGREATEFAALHVALTALPNLQGAANMALLDIVGQAAKAPVYQVLGGPTRNRARALASLTGADDAQLVAALKRAQAAGFRVFSIPVVAPSARNSGQPFVAANRNRLTMLRNAGGEQSDFVIDCGAALTPGDASSLSAALERLHPLWLDGPCELTHMAAVRKVAAERVTPLGFGRGATSASEFQDLMREDVIDILRPDLARNGITQIRKFAALAEANYIAVAPHHDGGPIGTAAALHLAASLPNFFVQQVPFPEDEEDRRFRAELAGDEIVNDGYLSLPAAPGLGLKINSSLLTEVA